MLRSMLKSLAIAAVLVTAAGCASSGNSSEDNGLNNKAIQNIMARKSVRAYSDQKVSDEQIQVLLKAAMAAPSGSDIRPWYYVVLNDPSTYEDIFSSQNFNLSRFQDASAVIVLCADTTVTRIPRGAPQGAAPTVQPNGTWRDDMGASTENLLLAAESLGLGAVWTALYPYHDRMDPVKESLALPSTVVPYCAVPIGYPEGKTEAKDKFDPTRIHYNKW